MLEHERNRGAAQRVSRCDVEVERFFEVLRRRVQERVRNGAADIVDDDVDPPERLVRRGREPRDVVEVGQIRGHDPRPPPGTLDPGRDIVQL